MTSHPSAAGAAMLAGLIVAGGAYSARTDLGLGAGLAASANARSPLVRQLLPATTGRRLLAWQAPPAPHIRTPAAAPPAPRIVALAAPSTAPIAPVASAAAPVTRTSPVAADDSGENGAGND